MTPKTGSDVIHVASSFSAAKGAQQMDFRWSTSPPPSDTHRAGAGPAGGIAEPGKHGRGLIGVEKGGGYSFGRSQKVIRQLYSHWINFIRKPVTGGLCVKPPTVTLIAADYCHHISQGKSLDGENSGSNLCHLHSLSETHILNPCHPRPGSDKKDLHGRVTRLYYISKLSSTFTMPLCKSASS